MEKALKILHANFDEMIKTIQKVISFDTVRKAPDGIYPFGKTTAECLDYVLGLAGEMGAKTLNCDYYAGHADFGEGDEVVGILGHLDVVPVSDHGWIYPPFSGTVADGRIYGRGAIDDKGPAICCLYVVKALMDSGFRPGKKIRLIFGCDEEMGSSCIAHYKTKIKMPDIGFTPDGEFPCLNGEKGLFQPTVDFGKLPDEVLDIRAGDRVNIVPDLCTAKLTPDADISALEGTDYVTVEKRADCCLLTAKGISCHGSTPEQGDNATWKMVRALHALYPENETLGFLFDKMITDTDGTTWGLPLRDEQSGKISISMNVLRLTEEKHLAAGIDMRFPVTYTVEQVKKAVEDNSPSFMKFIEISSNHPLYVPADSFLVTTLLDAYNSVTGEKAKPKVIGGGTYAKSMDNCVAFGPEFEGDEQTMHQTNEYINIERLRQMADIYLKAIYTLAK